MEVSEMLSGDVAKYQIQDRIRAAEMDRVARDAQLRRGGGSRAAVRKLGSGLMAVVGGVRLHASPKDLPASSRLKTA
jgi:hypothetical protein